MMLPELMFLCLVIVVAYKEDDQLLLYSIFSFNMYVCCEFGLFYGAKSKLIESLYSPRLC